MISNIVFRFLAKNCTLAELGPENKVFPTFFDLKFSSQIIKNAERAPQTNFKAFCYSRTFEKIKILANRAKSFNFEKKCQGGLVRAIIQSKKKNLGSEKVGFFLFSSLKVKTNIFVFVFFILVRIGILKILIIIYQQC